MVAGAGLLTALTGAALAAAVWESRAHRRTLAALPLRIHVNGTRGKTSVTRAIATLFRELGRVTVGKATGTLPIIIDPKGKERPLGRRGRPRIQEQVRFLRYAAAQKAQVAVIECMAVDPVLQWVAEHRLVRSHIGVITNVRRDHLEEMGRSTEQIARSLANTIPRGGVLVTGDARFAPLFAEVARPLGTRVVLADAVPTDAAAENEAIARAVAREAGFGREEIARVARLLPRPELPVTPLPAGARAELPAGVRRGDKWVHAWAVNDTDSFAALWTRAGALPAGWRVPLYNHRTDRPLRALDFGRFFARQDDVRWVFVTGQPGAASLFARAGVPRDRIVPIPFPPTPERVVRAVATVRESSAASLGSAALPAAPVVVVGCGNAQGLASLVETPPPGNGVVMEAGR